MAWPDCKMVAVIQQARLVAMEEEKNTASATLVVQQRKGKC